MEFFLQLLIEFVFDTAFDLIAALISGGFDGLHLPERASGWPVRVAQFIGGAVAGVISVFLFTARLTRQSPVPGMSLLLAPLATGLAMQMIGELWPDARRRSALFTFTGGATFALGMALVRLWYFALK